MKDIKVKEYYKLRDGSVVEVVDINTDHVYSIKTTPLGETEIMSLLYDGSFYDTATDHAKDIVKRVTIEDDPELFI